MDHQTPRRTQSARPTGGEPRTFYRGVDNASAARRTGAHSAASSQSSFVPARAYSRYEVSRNGGSYTGGGPNRSRRKMSKGKKIALGIAIALLVVLIASVTAFALYVKSVNDSFVAGVSEEEQMAINDALAPVVSYDEPFYMLLIGSDRRVNDDSMGARADTSIVARVDTANATITLISIPRDTQVTLPGYGRQKFNAAYAYEGTAGLIKAASDLCDVDISHYAEVNFEELIKLVDLVGGVTVNVPERIDDPMAGDVVIEAGEQMLDGEAALVFARSRQYYDGDFTRTSNQRVLIEALATKVLSLSVASLPSVLSSAAQSVTTDLTVSDILDLAMQIKNAEGELTIYSAMVPSTTGDENGISYVYAVEPDLSNMMDIVDAGGDPNDVETYAAIGSVLDVETAAE